MILNELDNKFNFIPLLREVFYTEYKKDNNPKENKKELQEKFNFYFKKANEKGIIVGNFWKDTYFTTFHDIDYIGLEQYKNTATLYANTILQKNKNNSFPSHTTKKLRKR